MAKGFLPSALLVQHIEGSRKGKPAQINLDAATFRIILGERGAKMTRDEIEAYLARVALGDRAAFEALYSATSAKLFGILLRILKERAAAEDALQDVYVKIWRHAARYQQNGLSPMTWLITIARNHAVDVLRRQRSAMAELDDAAMVEDLRPGPEALAIAGSDRQRLIGCFAELEGRQAEAVGRAYLAGESYAELAERFEIPLNTMRSWLRRGLLKLKECLTR